MDEPVCGIFDVVVTTAGAQIPFGIEVALQVSVGCGGHSIHSDVELATLVQKGFLHVFLDDVGALVPVDGCIVYDRLDLV